ncbi:CGLD27 family protein [Cyanobacterium sp. uoEpiScrs1]|uniref:CGLD27 family protein n=1 Tax=Cyanobacterium sp. uoEpiScrs1 TaxID=2976343 RepID=UPI00226AF8C1|nr:CGLD27 family protein [Cyanobacterium sp. uoEpiScrs1]
MKELPIGICPVPNEQQPVNEYEDLKKSCFFRWATLENKIYWRRITYVGLVGWILTSPIAAVSFSPRQSTLLFILCNNLGAGLMVSFIVIQLGLGWCYVGDRLRKKIVFYEESGWYDGQTWLKPPEILARDRLIVSYQIDPILQRLARTEVIIGGIIIADLIIWLSQ